MSFRPVPRTGVIYVMTEAARLGFRYGHPEWINLGQGAPETGPLPLAPPRLEHVRVDATHEYAPVGGVWELKEAVASLYNERYRRGLGSQYSAENVAIAGGGRTALTRLAAALGNVHLGHLLPDYTAYAELLDAFRAFVPLPLTVEARTGWALEPEWLREEIVGKGLGALLLSNPCNPTGHVLRGDALASTVHTCTSLGCVLVLDEFYAHYVYGSSPVGGHVPETVSAAAYVEDVDRDPVVVVDGLTKNWRYPGWRLSWTLGPRSVIEAVTSAGSFLDGGPAHPLQCAAIPLLDRSVADAEAAAIQRAFTAKRDRMVERARDLGLVLHAVPSGAFYGFVGLERLPEPLNDGMTFFQRALERKVIVVPGEFFDVDPGKRRGHIPSRLRSYARLSFGPEASAVEEGFDRLEQMIAR